ncbi:hypothetical protein [Sulfitobacter sp. SK012]|uniref:hypothetical protein n=1 Tax=Sulfitobacter sp. SK012 TaxID=1389005 RepID=UPI0013B3BAC2|nr:hypothetical protein [Sulfitobacter sp. SK012]
MRDNAPGSDRHVQMPKRSTVFDPKGAGLRDVELDTHAIETRGGHPNHVELLVFWQKPHRVEG